MLPPQKSAVVPQKPNSLQQTFKGQSEASDHSAPQPGSHSLFSLQEEVHPSPQKSGPRPQTPLPSSSLDFGISMLPKFQSVLDLQRTAAAKITRRRLGAGVLLLVLGVDAGDDGCEEWHDKPKLATRGQHGDVISGVK